MFKGLIKGGFHYYIRGVTISFNPLDLCQFLTLIWLIKGYNINHKPLFFSGSKLNEAFIKGETISIYNYREVSNPELLIDQGIYYREGNSRIYTRYY
jgi:hypothetical protein